jgi:hypothetical protein
LKINHLATLLAGLAMPGGLHGFNPSINPWIYVIHHPCDQIGQILAMLIIVSFRQFF